jgi:hypothetical protein
MGQKVTVRDKLGDVGELNTAKTYTWTAYELPKTVLASRNISSENRLP